MLNKLKQAIFNWLGVTSCTLPAKLSRIVLKDNDILVVYSEQMLSVKLATLIRSQLMSRLIECNYNNAVIVVQGGLTLGTISKEVE